MKNMSEEVIEFLNNFSPAYISMINVYNRDNKLKLFKLIFSIFL